MCLHRSVLSLWCRFLLTDVQEPHLSFCVVPVHGLAIHVLFLDLAGFVKFFGTLAVVDSPQQICERYPMFVEKVFSMAESLDPTMFGVAVDTLGILASKVEGKQVLHKMGLYSISFLLSICL